MASEAVDLLVSIDGTLKAILAALKATGPAGANVASDADLDGKYGDPVIKAKDPREWAGPTMMGRKFSECPPAYLDLVASRLDYFSEKAEAEGKTTSSGKPVAPFNRADAARARGWAARMRAGRHTPAPVDERGEIEI
jgi:hypothetical protein